jgi:hypothetical protein
VRVFNIMAWDSATIAAIVCKLRRLVWWELRKVATGPS